ncbi:hypothetical protein B0H34DRAFT_796242 [Crassisporium funariophilum]|nr:hypothetical protein B0H34DRAFT_796242 [Crassisporium funariophilum]
MSTSLPSPASDESSSEGSALRELVDDTIAQDRQAAMSPRSALLSHTSLKGQHPAVLVNVNGAVEPTRTRIRSTASDRLRKRERDLSNSSPSQRELVRLLIDQEQETAKLRKALYTAIQRVESESQRAADLERANHEATQRFRLLNENRVSAQQEASKANQETRLCHLQLENAQNEIERAKDSLKQTEKERDEAEAAAARAREKARKLHQQKIVSAAREEGRRLGFEAGFQHARKEKEILAARKPSNAAGASRRQTRNSNEASLPPGEVDVHQRAPRRPNMRQEEEKRTMDDIVSSPDMSSPSQLPIRNLPVDLPMDPPPMPASTNRASPLRPYQPPPESEPESSQASTPTPTTQPVPSQNEHYSRSKTPSIQVYAVNIPPQEELAMHYNANEDPNEIIKEMPREQWVTASKHREVRGSPPKYPGTQPPPLLPTARRPPVVRPVMPAPLAKTVKFPKLSRPSLAKTKQQASSWYRSLSFRKKNKPVIDPIPEEAPVPGPVTVESSANTTGHGPKAPTETSEGSEALYGVPPQPSQSWYQKESSIAGPSSVRSQDFAYPRRRPISYASTRVSQFDLLATPNPNEPQSVRSGKEHLQKVKEKDSLLSVIKEDPSSRGNTPSTDRYMTAGGRQRASSDNMAFTGPVVPAPTFGGHALQQQHSSDTFASSVPNKRRSRRPPTIAVPDPEAPLEPFGVAYARGPNGAAAGGQQEDYFSRNLTRQPSRISERTTPNTSIGIDVVPPSGFAPDAPQSPPHTGRNHLSPYHYFRPTASQTSLQVPHQQSMTSLRSQGGTHIKAPPPASGSKADSQRRESVSSDYIGYPNGPPDTTSQSQLFLNSPQHQYSGSKSDTRKRGSVSSDYVGYPNGPPDISQFQRSLRSPESQGSQRPPSASGWGYQAYGNPVASSNRSRRETQTPGPESGRAGKRPQPQPINVNHMNVEASSAGLDGVHRIASNVSLRSAGSYNHFENETYLDPAYFASPPKQKPEQSGGGGGGVATGRPRSRAASEYSNLSYV